MQEIAIDPGVAAAVRDFKVPDSLGFGVVNAPVMYSAEWRDGHWHRGRLLPHGPIAIWPGARGLQYAETVFEGLKAYRVGQARPNLFRWRSNFQRLGDSARRLSMPAVPEWHFLGGIESVVRACAEHIPGRSGQSLYLRPFLFGSENGFLLRNSEAFRFMVIASPVESYASGAPTVAIERSDVRAVNGGIGAVKAAANYAAAFRASAAAGARGQPLTLWLDAESHSRIQELSGMNFFAVIDGALHTPELDGSVLPGITRDSLIVLARHLGYTVCELPMTIGALAQQIRTGQCTEIFACGTAAIVMPIAALVETDGTEYRPACCNDTSATLRQALLAIQECTAPDPFGWTHAVE